MIYCKSEAPAYKLGIDLDESLQKKVLCEGYLMDGSSWKRAAKYQTQTKPISEQKFVRPLLKLGH